MEGRHSGLTLAVAVVAISCGAAGPTVLAADEGPCTLSGADVQAIREMKEAHEAQGLSADWEAMSTIWAPDIVAMLPNQPAIRGRDPLLAWSMSFPPFGEYELTFEEVEGCGDLAYVKGRYSIAPKPTESGEVSRDSGNWIWILRKDADGRWLVTHDISNSDRPAQPAE